MTDEQTQSIPVEPSSAPQKSKLFEGAIQNWKFVLKFLIFSIVFFAIQFAWQMYVIGADNVDVAFLRAAGFAGTFFFSFALLSSSIFKFKPKYAKYWDVRRSFGVVGWLFIAMHFNTVVRVYFAGDYSGLLLSLDPFVNPIIFGLLAYPIFMIMALTSTDWAVDRLGQNVWKSIHRLVYFGYAFAIFHILTVNPPLLQNPMGYLLLAFIGATLLGELYWFVKGIQQKRIKTLGTVIGIIVILMYLIFIYLTYL